MSNHKRIEKFVDLVTGLPIDAYSNESATRKEKFAREAKAVLRLLAKELGIERKGYDLRWNPGGIAVCGEATLHADNLYVQFTQSCLGPAIGFMYRSCKGRKDYTGGPNQWMRWQDLRDIESAAEEIKRRAGLTVPTL